MEGFFVLAPCFLFNGVFSAEVVSVSGMEGGSVTLHTGVTRQQLNKMLWYFKDYRIALINGEASKSCLFDGEDGRFRDRLKVDYESGSLTISDIRPEDAGRYEAELIRSESSGTSQRLNRTHKCDPTKITRKTINLGEPIKTINVTVTDPFKLLQEGFYKNEDQKSDRSSGLFADVPGSGQSSSVPGSGLSSAAVSGISAPVLLVSAAAVIHCHT